MRQLLIALLLVAAAGGVAALVRRRAVPDAPSTPRSHTAPVQIDRADFERPDTPWLVVVFSSSTCPTCALVLDKARVVASNEVAVQDAEYTACRRLHQRYGIDAVPTVVVADSEGVVRASFIGPMSATDLWAAIAEARQPGSSPEPGLGRDLS
jgi:protein-disulfide isomerase